MALNLMTVVRYVTNPLDYIVQKEEIALEIKRLTKIEFLGVTVKSLLQRHHTYKMCVNIYLN